MKDYSQHGEQAIILDYFEKQGIQQGRFLDIGANDGITFSNSYALVLKDWKGVAVEASPYNFCKLKENYKEFPIDLLCACVGQEQGIIKFYNAQDGTVSTPNLENKKVWETETPFTEIYLSQIRLIEISKQFGATFDFINIDVEGGSFELYKRMHGTLLAKMICLEHDNYADEAAAIGVEQGYKEIHRNGTNIILAK